MNFRSIRYGMIAISTTVILMTVGNLWLTQPFAAVTTGYAQGGYALRFFGTGPTDVDRVKIPLGPISNGQITASRPVNVGGDFTIEFWMKANAADNTAAPCDSGAPGWYFGNILVDRDVFGDDVGDYGIALRGGRIIFGVNNGSSQIHLCGTTQVTNGAWRHIAVTRSASTGQMRIFVDGQPDAQASGPTGMIAYPPNRATGYPNSDPYLVLAAEKHDYPNSLYYAGLLDDLRISNIVRYNGPFTRPSAPHPADANTVALYRFDEGSGTSIGDSSGAAGGPSPGTLNPRSGGPAQHWSSDTPFGSSAPSPMPTASPTASPTPNVSPTAGPNPTPRPTSTPRPDATATPAPRPCAVPSPSVTPGIAPSATSGATPGATLSPTPSATASAIPGITFSPTPSATASAIPGITFSPTPDPRPGVDLTPTRDDRFRIYLPLILC